METKPTLNDSGAENRSTSEILASPRASILDEVREIVTGTRGRNYGHPLENHENEAALWSAWLNRRFRIDIQLTARDVCWLMVLLKSSRDANCENRDNVRDAIGYLENADEVTLEKMRREAN